MAGLTFVLCFGKYAKPHIRKYERSFRICVGWVAFTIYFYDREVEMHRLLVVHGVIKDDRHSNIN